MSFTTHIRLQKRRVKLPGKWALGASVCYNNPEDCCGVGDRFASQTIRVQKRTFILPKGWVGDARCVDQPLCCDEAPGTGTEAGASDTGTGTSISSCCGYDLPPTLRVLVYSSTSTQRLNATWNGSYWVASSGPNYYGLRCNAGQWQIGSGCTGTGITEWVDATDSRCYPFFYAGISGGMTCIADTVSVSFLGQAGGETGTGGSYPGYILRVKLRTLKLPKISSLSYCIDDPNDCCDESPDCQPNPYCSDLSPILCRISPTGFAGYGSDEGTWDRLNREIYLTARPRYTFTDNEDAPYRQYRMPTYLSAPVSSLDPTVNFLVELDMDGELFSGVRLPVLRIRDFAGAILTYKGTGPLCTSNQTFTFDRVEFGLAPTYPTYPTSITVEVTRTARCSDSLTCSSSGADRRAFAFAPTGVFSTCINLSSYPMVTFPTVMFPVAGTTCEWEGYNWSPLNNGLSWETTLKEVGIRLRYLGGSNWEAFVYDSIAGAIAGGATWIHQHTGTFTAANVNDSNQYKQFTGVTSTGGCGPYAFQGFY